MVVIAINMLAMRVGELKILEKYRYEMVNAQWRILVYVCDIRPTRIGCYG